MESTFLLMMLSIKLMENHLALNNFYRTIKFSRKATTLNQLIKFKAEESGYIFHKQDSRKLMLQYDKNWRQITSIIDQANIKLKKKLMLQYLITENKVIYSHKYWEFQCSGYHVLKRGKGQTLASRIRQYREKRCGNCKLLIVKRKKKKKKFVKRYKCKECKKVYYCNKYCQKRHWIEHRLHSPSCCRSV